MNKFNLMGWILIGTGLGACSQVAPPVTALPGDTLSGSQGGNPVGAANATRLSLDESVSGTIQLTLFGADAKKVYVLMGLAPESLTASETNSARTKKTGRDFSCSRTSELYSCEFKIVLPRGTFNVIREEKDLLKAAPEGPQIAESNAYLTISSPDKKGKVRLQVLDADGEKIFKALQVSTTFDLMPDQNHGPGVHKAGGQVNCIQSSTAAHPEHKLYACYLHLDTTLGSVDAIDPGQMD
jgi:hypothetical protein